VVPLVVSVKARATREDRAEYCLSLGKICSFNQGVKGTLRNLHEAPIRT
jgi:hypothetical protein